MAATNQLVCQLDFIHYLFRVEPYTYVMIDDSELLFLQARSGTLKDKASISMMWEALKYHIMNAKYVRCYDGFMGRMTMVILQDMGILNVFVVRMPVASQSNGRTMFVKPVSFGEVGQTKWLMAWAMDIGRRVAAGKQSWCFTRSKKCQSRGLRSFRLRTSYAMKEASIKIRTLTCTTVGWINN